MQERRARQEWGARFKDSSAGLEEVRQAGGARQDRGPEAPAGKGTGRRGES